MTASSAPPSTASASCGAPRNLDDIRSLGLGKELFLRVNPNIVVDVEVTAGSLNTERVPHLGKVRVTAGGAKLLDVHEINDALIQAGQATIKGAITTGRHRIRAESGSLSITLADESNVTVKGDAQLGKVSWSGGHNGAGDEVVMGNGSAKLDIEVVMGHAQVRVGSDRGRGGRVRVSDRARRPSTAERHEHRAPSDCPVCGDHLAVTRLGCGSCGSELAGVFRPCEFCALDDARDRHAPGVPGLARQPARGREAPRACPIRRPGCGSPPAAQARPVRRTGADRR